MQNTGLVVGGGAVVAVAVAVAIVMTPRQGGDAPVEQTPAALAAVEGSAAPEEVASDEVATEPQAAPADTDAQDADAVVVEAAPAAADPSDVAVVEGVADASPQIPLLTDRRFEPDGGYLMSGTAAPGLPLAVFVDGAEVERFDVGADGSFLAIGFLGMSDAPRVLELVSDPDGAATRADEKFIMAASVIPEVIPETVDVAQADPAAVEPAEEIVEQVAAAVPDTDATPMNDQPVEEEGALAVTEPNASASDVAEAEPASDPVNAEDVAPIETVAEADAAADVAVDPGQGETALVEPSQASAPETTVAVQSGEGSDTQADVAQTANAEPAAPSTPAILAVTPEGVEVVQAPIARDTPPEVMSNVALDTITYNLDGDVVLGGRALGQGFVQVYVDNAPVSRLPVDEDGTWRGDLPDVDTGVYTLRIDEVDAGGDVVSRIETPFLREDPADVIEVMAEEVADPNFTVATRTVQPGATLWAIAEERYGSGVLYVNVFEANKDRIRDPDLIYPGQVFILPEGSGADSN